ncbi:MAG: DUF3368 domain-containing protein [Bacteroidota bacterium]
MIVISDTSVIINLYKVGHLELLHQIFGKIRITPGVLREIYEVPEEGKVIEEIDWITLYSPVNQAMVSKLLEELDLGESESIAAAHELGADYLIIDESLERAVAERLNLKIVGILGVLLIAKEKGLIPVIGPVIVALRNGRFYLSDAIVNSVLKQTGETPE